MCVVQPLAAAPSVLWSRALVWNRLRNTLQRRGLGQECRGGVLLLIMNAILVIEVKTLQNHIQTKTALNLFYWEYQEGRQSLLEPELHGGCFCPDITLLPPESTLQSLVMYESQRSPFS